MTDKSVYTYVADLVCENMHFKEENRKLKKQINVLNILFKAGVILIKRKKNDIGTQTTTVDSCTAERVSLSNNEEIYTRNHRFASAFRKKFQNFEIKQKKKTIIIIYL